MRKLSEVASYHEVFINPHNIASILTCNGWIKRKVSIKPFSNWSIASVVINKEKFLIDSRIDVVHTGV